jgi:hypothetical protein
MIPINLIPLATAYWPHFLAGLFIYTMFYLFYDRNLYISSHIYYTCYFIASQVNETT